MGQKFEQLNEKHIDFIKKQKVFFVATAAKEGRINLSPKGLNSLRVESNQVVHWFNLTGSGNETAAHLSQSDRMTIMFCEFEAEPLIMRLFGSAKIYHPEEKPFTEIKAKFENEDLAVFKQSFGDGLGIRQMIELKIDLVQTSCGWGVPLMEYKGNRDLLPKWAKAKGEEGIQKYWKEKNQVSIDGLEIYP